MVGWHTLTVTSSRCAIAIAVAAGDYASSIFTAAGGVPVEKITHRPASHLHLDRDKNGELWNTGANKKIKAAVPTSSDSALISTGTNTITVADGENVVINRLTLNASDTLAVT